MKKIISTLLIIILLLNSNLAFTNRYRAKGKRKRDSLSEVISRANKCMSKIKEKFRNRKFSQRTRRYKRELCSNYDSLNEARNRYFKKKTRKNKRRYKNRLVKTINVAYELQNRLNRNNRRIKIVEKLIKTLKKEKQRMF